MNCRFFAIFYLCCNPQTKNKSTVFGKQFSHSFCHHQRRQNNFLPLIYAPMSSSKKIKKENASSPPTVIKIPVEGSKTTEFIYCKENGQFLHSYQGRWAYFTMNGKFFEFSGFQSKQKEPNGGKLPKKEPIEVIEIKDSSDDEMVDYSKVGISPQKAPTKAPNKDCLQQGAHTQSKPRSFASIQNIHEMKPSVIRFCCENMSQMGLMMQQCRKFVSAHPDLNLYHATQVIFSSFFSQNSKFIYSGFCFAEVLCLQSTEE